MTTIVVILTSLFAVQTVDASAGRKSDQQWLVHAESAFAQGVALRNKPEEARKHFSGAAQAYETLYRRGITNVHLLHNWGKAALLADDLPKAVLAWRLALRLDPSKTDIQNDLEYARDLVEYPSGNIGRPYPSPWPDWLPQVTAFGIWSLWMAIYVLGWLLLLLWIITRRSFLFTSMCFCLAAFVGLTIAGWTVSAAEGENNRYPLVVVKTEHALRTGNGSSYDPHETIPTARRGMEARLLYRRGSWMQLEFDGGYIGWVPESVVLIE